MYLNAFQNLARRYFPASQAVLLAVGVGFASVGYAQQSSDAVVLGSVIDGSHASVSDASVRLTHIATNGVTEVHTDGRGQ